MIYGAAVSDVSVTLAPRRDTLTLECHPSDLPKDVDDTRLARSIRRRYADMSSWAKLHRLWADCVSLQHEPATWRQHELS